MLDHVSIAVTDIPRAARFHDPVMAALGVPCVWREERAIGYGRRNSAQDDGHSYLTLRLGAAPADPACHWCFRAPGLRPHYHPDYYAAFLRDPDGNRIEAVCHRDEAA